MHAAVPLPPSAEDEEAKQDLHLGRVRTFAHVEGNYATHVYITVAVPKACLAGLEASLQECKRSISDLHPTIDAALPKTKSGFKAPFVQATYHLSLSRVVAVHYPQIQPLIASLKQHLSKTQRFKVSFGRLEAFENDDKTRSFLSILVDQGFDQVCRAVRRTNRAFAEHGLQQFHKDPRPHVSLMWALGSTSQRLVTLSQEVQTGLGLALQEHPWECNVSKIECRVGQRIYAVWEAIGS